MLRSRSLALALLALVAPSSALAQADPVLAGAPAGYELAVSGAPAVERGHPLRLHGVAYEVERLATLQAREGLVVDATLTVRTGPGEARRPVGQAQATTQAEGRFQLSLPVPTEPLSAPMVELVVHRPSRPGRRFSFPVQVLPDEALDLLTDRSRYQPGERIRTWIRVRSVRTQAPRPDRLVELQLLDGGGRPLARREARTSEAGVVSVELALPEGADVGAYRVRAEVSGGPRRETSIQVWRRTVERLLGEVEVTGRDRDGVSLVAPGGPLRGRVWARTPSGTPIRDAEVEVRVRADAEPLRLTTGADGSAAFELRAPALLAGDVGRETLQARIVHPAHGATAATADYLVARVRAVVSATARGGALVPEVPSAVYLGVTDPRGRPLRAGTPLSVRGEGITNVTLTLDERGYAEVPITLPRGAASTLRTGPCSGQIATTLEVEVGIDPPAVSRVCARVSDQAEVAPRLVGPPIVAPGQTVELELARRPGAGSRPVLVEALWSGRAVASAWAPANERRARLELPADVLGAVTLRARMARPADALAPANEPGATGLGVGGLDVVLVRPADAFSLRLHQDRTRYLVRERAPVELAATRPPAGPAWVALLARDEAAHGGEGPWELSFFRHELHAAAWEPDLEANARLVRAALARGLGLDPEPAAAAPLDPPYWQPPRSRGYTDPAARGVMRDPIALREELLRRGLGPVEQLLEQLVTGLGPDAGSRASIVEARGGRLGFHPAVVEHLVATRRLAERSALTLGGERLSVAMIEAADPGFSFDTVARRVARARLARLLLALSRLADPDDPAAQRASASLPPERWLGTLVQLGMVQARELSDPWGNGFVFRRVTGRRPRVAVSERALDWELASAGPDGRLGTADDVSDPFARAIPEGTPYAVVSGEEALMRRLAALAPAQEVLNRMSRAYARVALAAAEELRVGPVGASSSEGADERMPEPAADADGEAEEAQAQGYGRGGGGFGRSVAVRPAPAPQAPSPPTSVSRERQARAEAPGEPSPASRDDAFGAMIREDFPATLFFVGEVTLGADGRARVEVPLADALTTYRLEAIAWSRSGWTTTAGGRLQVDQPALVDAPIPPVATAGDRVRLPVRVENRGDEPLAAQIAVHGEGSLSVGPLAPLRLEIPARAAREAVVELSLPTPGEGALVVAVAAADGQGLDAVRRPLRVLADARAARERRLELVEGVQTLTLEIPAAASERGPGQLAVAVGVRLFGDPAERTDSPLWAAWALAMAGERAPDPIVAAILPWLAYEDRDGESLRDAHPSALALGAAWTDERLTDADAGRGLRAVSRALPAPEAARRDPEVALTTAADRLLIALAPLAGALERRPELRADAEALLGRLRALAALAGARATEPEAWARAAAGLALSGERARAEELVRRADRHVVRVGALAWLEPSRADDEADGRAEPTAALALALGALGRRAEALELLRGLVMILEPTTPSERLGGARSRTAELPLPEHVHALAAAAAAQLGQGSLGAVRVTLDGQPVEVTAEGSVPTAVLPGIGRPGTHTLRVETEPGVVALVSLSANYGMPWDVPPRRAAPIALALDGQLGARDTRSGLRLRVQNRGARLVGRPVVELELPAGAELDEATRERLADLLRAPARQEGRTLVLPLRALAPGGWTRVPIPARWAVGGALRGLGAVAYDEADPSGPIAVLPSRALELPDEGPEPAPPDAETSPPEPIPPPIPILRRLAPGAPPGGA